MDKNSENLVDEIDHFIGVYKRHLDFLNVDLQFYGTLYKKIVCVGVIDTLSKTVYPNNMYQNKIRFTKFLKNYASHDIWNKVSLGHLVKLIQLEKHEKFNRIEDYANKQLGPSNFSPKPEFIDPNILEIENMWPKDHENMHGIKLFDLMHVNLFYNYRNNIIHELSRPGGLYRDDINNSEPFYYHVSSDQDNGFWRLVYPLGFFHHICTVALMNSRNYFIEKCINPNDVVGYKNYMIEKLN